MKTTYGSELRDLKPWLLAFQAPNLERLKAKANNLEPWTSLKP